MNSLSGKQACHSYAAVKRTETTTAAKKMLHKRLGSCKCPVTIRWTSWVPVHSWHVVSLPCCLSLRPLQMLPRLHRCAWLQWQVSTATQFTNSVSCWSSSTAKPSTPCSSQPHRMVYYYSNMHGCAQHAPKAGTQSTAHTSNSCVLKAQLTCNRDSHEGVIMRCTPPNAALAVASAFSGVREDLQHNKQKQHHAAIRQYSLETGTSKGNSGLSTQ
jgi:hypothetical protein